MVTKRRSAKKKDGARSVRHGNVTYSSRPSDNTDCRIRCSPPSRSTFGDGSKQTTVRYRHRTLDIKSPPSGKKRKPGVRTGPKTVPKTAKTAKKTVPKAPAKKTVPKTVPKAPKAPETPSKLSALVKELEKEVQKPKAPAKKPTAREVILKKAAEEGMNAKELDKHLIVGGIPKAEPKTTAKKPVAKAPAKAPAKPTAPIQSRGVAGKFDAKQMKEIMSFVDKLKGRSRKAEPMRVPIFRQSASFIDEGRIMLVKVTSRIPGKSLVGLPLSKTKADIWVPADKIKARIGQMAKDVQTVEYVDESFKGAYEGAGQLRFMMGNLVASTQAYDYYGQEPKIPPLFKKRTQEDVIFRTTQSRFATDMKKAMDSCPKDGQCVVQVCPEGKYSRNEGMVPNECSTYDADYMKMIANVISKAKNSSCVVMYRPNWPIKVVCDFGMYLVEIFLAPVVNG